jgi:hypothetical protein
MYKIVELGSWDFGIEPVAMIKVSSNGLIGYDRQQFLTKRAGCGMFADLLNKIAIHPGDMPVHTIAIGATEFYGPNRNADGFCENTCIKRAYTFEAKPLSKYASLPTKTEGARYYMNHENDDPLRSYGYIKAAAYNKPMHRVELLMIGNGTKEAAERNGGLVLPDQIKEALYDGEFQAGSMSCVLPFDKCAICGNEAPGRAEYCTKESCVGADGIQGFGCKDGLGRLLKTGRQQYVENPNCTFFDFSDVSSSRPADRTAYGGLARDFMKAAANVPVIGGARLAERYGLLADGFVMMTPQEEYCAKQIKLAMQLADMERDMDASPSTQDEATKAAFHPLVRPIVNTLAIGRPGNEKFSACIRALAENEVLLTPEEFLCVAAPSRIPSDHLSKIASEMKLWLPGIFRKLAFSDSLRGRLNHAFSIDVTVIPTSEQRSFAKEAAKTASYCVCGLSKRASLAVLRGANLSRKTPIANIIKEASAEAGKLAEEYALYQLATLAASRKDQSPLTLRAVLVHNRC